MCVSSSWVAETHKLPRWRVFLFNRLFGSAPRALEAPSHFRFFLLWCFFWCQSSSLSVSSFSSSSPLPSSLLSLSLSVSSWDLFKLFRSAAFGASFGACCVSVSSPSSESLDEKVLTAIAQPTRDFFHERGKCIFLICFLCFFPIRLGHLFKLRLLLIACSAFENGRRAPRRAVATIAIAT